jgi:hypothetical protein
MQTLSRKGDSLAVSDADTTSKGGFTGCVGCRHYLERGDSLTVWNE